MEIQGKLILVRVCEGSSYRESTVTVMQPPYKGVVQTLAQTTSWSGNVFWQSLSAFFY